MVFSLYGLIKLLSRVRSKTLFECVRLNSFLSMGYENEQNHDATPKSQQRLLSIYFCSTSLVVMVLLFWCVSQILNSSVVRYPAIPQVYVTFPFVFDRGNVSNCQIFG